ncbi:MAG: nucleotidyl transferase AbiEii/AbiGii toxin family protein [Luteolibacter sp.]
MKTYSSAFAFRRALEDRLATTAKAENIDLQRMRRQVAFDRLLARLFAEGNPPWRLKGGYALELKLAVARSTRDLDLGLSSLQQSPVDLVTALQNAVSKEADDFFVYQIGGQIMELDGAPYGGSRHPVEAHLDGRLFARFHLDVGLGDIQQEPYEWIDSRDWLGFAGIPAGRFPTISREEHFAQKIHAYTLPRGERANTRVKDLIWCFSWIPERST